MFKNNCLLYTLKPAGGFIIWHSTQNCFAKFSLTETNITQSKEDKKDQLLFYTQNLFTL
jgi:hypothetical protein